MFKYKQQEQQPVGVCMFDGGKGFYEKRPTEMLWVYPEKPYFAVEFASLLNQGTKPGS